MTTETKRNSAEKAPRTRSKEERKRQLIDATIAIIAKNGIPGTTMTAVTQEAGLSLGLVNFHFESKKKLFEETLLFLALEHQEMWQNAIEGKNLSPEDSILAIVDAHFHPKVGSRKKLATWFAFYGDSQNRASYRHIAEDIDDARYDRLVALITVVKDSGDFTDVDPDDVATMLEAMFDGLCLTMLIYPTDATCEDAKRNIRTYLVAMFPGRFAQQPPPS